MILKGNSKELIKDIKNNYVDLILIDPPYIISRKSNFKNHSKNTSDELIKKYSSLSIDFGEWDKEEIDWDFMFKEYYRVLRQGGTLIIFYDIWKSGNIKYYADKYKFKQSRVCQWQKSNPVPVNSKINYLSNSIEYFFSFTKGKNPTFNSIYDNGVYVYPICHGKERYNHPTQKPLSLISDIIKKHSNERDMVLDTFAGTFTTHVACVNLNRECISMEIDEDFYKIGEDRLLKKPQV